MKSLNNYNIVARFVNLSQDKILMKLMYILFQMSERRFMFRWEEIKIVRVKRDTFFYFIENKLFKGIGLQRLSLISEKGA